MSGSETERSGVLEARRGGGTTSPEQWSDVVDELSEILKTIPKRTAPKGVAPTRQPRVKRRVQRPVPIPLPPPPQRPAQLQQAVESKLMTFDELKAKVGSAPKPDRLGGKWKMSKRYKALQTAVGTSQDAVDDLEATPASDLRTDRAAVEGGLVAEIDKMIAAALAYKNGKKKQGKKDAAQALIDQATKYKNDLAGNLDKVLGDPKFAAIAGSCTIGEAIAAKIRGLNFEDCKFDVHNDTMLNNGLSTENFGSGAVNSVSKLVHQDGVPRVFKPEPSSDPKMKVGPRNAGIDGEAPHYGNRNVASKIAADLLGLDVMPEASFATHNGEVGLMMGMAKGKSPRQKEWEDVDQDWAEKEGEINRKNYGIEKKNDRWMKGKDKMKKPWDNPPSEAAQMQLQEQLNGLEWTDMLTGQVDRHSANYFVDVTPTGAKVTGIDNDFCFGKNQKTTLKYNLGIGVTSPGEPVLIDKKAYDKLIAIDFDRDFKPKLDGLLTVEEIDASRDRINATIALARGLQTAGMVVDNWKTWRSPGPPPNKTAAEFMRDAPGKNLFKRDLAAFFEEDGLL